MDRAFVLAACVFGGCSTRDTEPTRPLESATQRDLGSAPAHPRVQPDAAQPHSDATVVPRHEVALRPATVASGEERSAAVLALLSDGVTAKRLPVVSTDADASFDAARADEMARTQPMPYVKMDWPFAEEDVPGELDPDLLRERVRRSFLPLHDCYVHALADKPTLHGSVSLSFEVARDGRVRGTEILDDSLADPAVGRCMAKASLSWTLARPSDGKPARVTLHFNLSPGTDPDAGER